MRLFLRFLNIIFFTFVMYVITHLIVLFLLPAGIVLAIFRLKKSIRSLKVFFSKSLFWIIDKKIKIIGNENLSENEKYLIVSNYPSFYSTFALMMLFPDAAMVAHAFTSKIPFLGSFLKMSGYIFVSSKNSRKSYRNMEAALKDAERACSIIIYPEGKRSPDGEIHEFKRGFIYILKNSGLDLLPVTMNGFCRLKPMKRFYIDPEAKLEIIFHAPHDNETVRKLPDRDILARTKRIIEKDYRA